MIPIPPQAEQGTFSTTHQIPSVHLWTHYTQEILAYNVCFYMSSFFAPQTRLCVLRAMMVSHPKPGTVLGTKKARLYLLNIKDVYMSTQTSTFECQIRPLQRENERRARARSPIVRKWYPPCLACFCFSYIQELEFLFYHETGTSPLFLPAGQRQQWAKGALSGQASGENLFLPGGKLSVCLPSPRVEDQGRRSRGKAQRTGLGMPRVPEGPSRLGRKPTTPGCGGW